MKACLFRIVWSQSNLPEIIFILQTCSKVVTHGSDWGPALEKHRALDPRYKASLGPDECAMRQTPASGAKKERTSKEMKDVLEKDFGKDNLTFADDHL